MSVSHFQTLLIIQAWHNALCCAHSGWSSHRGSRGGASWPWSGVQQWWICWEWLTAGDMSTLQSWQCFIPWNRKLLQTKKNGQPWHDGQKYILCLVVIGKHRSYQIPFLRIDFGKPSFQVFMKYPVYLHLFSFHECIWLYNMSWAGNAHNHHRRLVAKRQLSPFTAAEIAPGYVWFLYPIQWLGLSAGGEGRKWVGPSGHAAHPCRGILGLLETRAVCLNHSVAKQIKALVWRLLSLFAAIWFDLLGAGTV